jgi:hypothetical protein
MSKIILKFVPTSTKGRNLIAEFIPHKSIRVMPVKNYSKGKLSWVKHPFLAKNWSTITAILKKNYQTNLRTINMQVWNLKAVANLNKKTKKNPFFLKIALQIFKFWPISLIPIFITMWKEIFSNKKITIILTYTKESVSFKILPSSSSSVTLSTWKMVSCRNELKCI